MLVTLVGVKKSNYKGKDGSAREGFNYCGLKEFTRYELENADCEGQDVIREWSNTGFNVHPGDVVEFIYEPGFQEKATLVDIRPVSMGGAPFDDKKTAAQDKAADAKEKARAGA